LTVNHRFDTATYGKSNIW